MTSKTKKVQKALTLVAPTKEHPGQAQVITDDVVVGHWRQVKMSGAMPLPAKQSLVEKVERLQKAVKFAREQANMGDAPEQHVGSAVFEWLLK